MSIIESVGSKEKGWNYMLWNIEKSLEFQHPL